MDNSETEAGALRDMVKSAADQCTDALLLDLVYKILVHSK